MPTPKNNNSLSGFEDEEIVEQEQEEDTLLIEDEDEAYGFVQLKKFILYAKNISRDAKILYAFVLGYAYQEKRCFPGYKRLCLDMGASENMVRKYMRELEDVNLIRQKRRGLGRTNLYYICATRTSKIEVQEHHKTEVAKPSKTEVKEETYKKEEDLIKSNNRIRKSVNNAPDKRGVSSPYSGAVYGYQKPNSAEEKPKSQKAEYPLSFSGLISTAEILARYQPVQLNGHLKSNHRTLGKEDRDDIRQFFLTFLKTKLNDENEEASVGQAINVFAETTLSKELFFNKAYEALTATLKANVQKKRSQNVIFIGQKNKVPYFFKTLRDKCGLQKEG